jgi:ubiquinone/menaquinone biosynthesis C-methylase UbiE
MAKPQTPYIPALSYDWLTKFYDPLIKWGMQEDTFKNTLIEQAQIKEGFKLLDIGCGTATLTILIKQQHPSSDVYGIDGDDNILTIAQEKVANSGLTVNLRKAMAYQLPYPDNYFDRIFSSLVFHHLTTENKEQAFREILRVLKPNGEFHLADWDKGQNLLMKIASLTVQLLDGFQTTADNFQGRLQKLIVSSGFKKVERTKQFMTVLGTLSLFKCSKSN